MTQLWKSALITVLQAKKKRGNKWLMANGNSKKSKKYLGGIVVEQGIGKVMKSIVRSAKLN
jgi:hypothetical protein